MIRCLCDLCGKNEAAEKFKVKQLKNTVISDFHVRRWLEIDICESCYHILLRNAKINAPKVYDVAVVLCKDCKYLTYEYGFGECRRGYLGTVNPNRSFCSYGELKEEIK